jgi:hypothetical protein
VEHVLGLESQLALISDWLPWSTGTNHARTLRRAFHAHVLDPDHLDQLARRVIKETLEDIQDIDDALLVRLRVDVENAPTTRPDLVVERDRLTAATGSSLQDAVAQSRPEVTRAIAAEVATLVASEFVTWSVLRGAAASGLLAAGTASAPISLGVGLAAFLAVDQAMCWAVDRWADPRGTLVRGIRTKLVELRRLVLEGSPKAPGLRSRLEQILRERSAARRTRIFQTLVPIPAEAN